MSDVFYDGMLFGTTYNGGTFGFGSVFELNTSTGMVTTIASFNATNGANPNAQLITDGNGNLFGTTVLGGNGGYGTVFKLNINSGVITPLVSFTGPNGANPEGGLVEDSSGNLYGTTVGDTTDNEGTVFEVNPSTGAFNNFVIFTGPNGAYPNAALTMDGSGNLFGTTSGDGVNNEGTLFEINPNTGAFNNLVIFTGPNGAIPKATFTRPQTAIFLEYAAGTGSTTKPVFDIQPSTAAFTTIATFTNSNNDPYPVNQLYIDSSGNVFGETQGYGSNNEGIVFEITPGTGGVIPLATFTRPNGACPNGGLTADANGNLYGTTYGDKSSNDGTAFELNPSTGNLTTFITFDGANGGQRPNAPHLRRRQRHVLWHDRERRRL